MSSVLAGFISDISCTPKDTVYNNEYWHALATAVRSRRATTEYLDSPALAAEIQEIHQLHVIEVKEKKKLEQGMDGQDDELDDGGEDEEEADPADDPSAGFQHMMVGDTPSLPFKNAAVTKTDEAKKLSDKLLAFKKLAQRKVPWFIQLVLSKTIHVAFGNNPVNQWSRLN